MEKYGENKESGNGSKVVINSSQAYGYKYSSLADIANSGVKIPAMRVKPTEFGEYIEYKDEKGEWQLGAKVVIPEMKSCNAAQAYGSAITYARRYTVQLAMGIACDDDSKIETQFPENKSNYRKTAQNNARATNARTQTAKPAPVPTTKADEIFCVKVRSQLPKKKTVEELEAYWKELKLSQKYQAELKPYFAKRKEEINGVE